MSTGELPGHSSWATAAASDLAKAAEAATRLGVSPGAEEVPDYFMS